MKDGNSKLKNEVESGVAELARALGAGYGYCYDHLKNAGIDLVGHSFDDYCADLAKAALDAIDGKDPGSV